MFIHKFLKRTIHFSLLYVELLSLVIVILAGIVTVTIFIREKFILLSYHSQADQQKISKLTAQLEEAKQSQQPVFSLSSAFDHKKFIDGKVYSFEDVNRSTKNKPLQEKSAAANFVLRENGRALSTDQQPLGRAVVSLLDSHVIDYWVDFGTNSIILIREFPPDWRVPSQVLIEKHIFVDGAERETTTLKVPENGLLSISIIEHFFPKQNVLLMRQEPWTEGGERCGDAGTFHLLGGNYDEESLLYFTAGCSFSLESFTYRYGGMLNSKLVVEKALVSKDDTVLNSNHPVDLLELYLLDPLTQTKQTIKPPRKDGFRFDLLEKIAFINDSNDLTNQEIVLAQVPVDPKSGNSEQFVAYDITTQKMRVITR